MSDDLRTRIAAVLRTELLQVEYSRAEESADGEQWVFIDGSVIPEALADAVIRELASDCATGCMWQIPRHVEDMTDRQREFITRAYEDTLESTAIAAMRAIDEHNARDRGHWTEGEQ